MRGDAEVHLTAKAYAILLLLVEQAGSLISKDELLEKIWPEGFVEPANLTQTIYVLRKSLNDADSRLIETVPGRGYRFTSAVKVSDGLAPAGAGFRPWGNPAAQLRPMTAAKRRRAVWAFPVALMVLAALSVHSSTPPRTSRPVVSIQAQRDYVLGRHYWSQRTLSGMRRGLSYFQAATKLDPDYAQAYSGIADSYSALAYYGMPGREQKRLIGLARDAAARALLLDPDAAEAHASIAFIDEIAGAPFRAQAQREYQRSLELDNGYATAHEWYSWYLYYQGHQNEATAQMRLARNLDPLSPIINFALGYELFFNRRYSESASQWHETIAIEPYSPESYLGAGLADGQLGHHDLALRELRRAMSLAPGDADVMGALAYEYARVRQAGAASRLLATITKMKPVPALDVALVKIGLGQRDQAEKWLEIAKKYSGDDLEIALDPRLDGLRRVRVGERPQATSNG